MWVSAGWWWVLVYTPDLNAIAGKYMLLVKTLLMVETC
jgi:hypothetical protein